MAKKPTIAELEAQLAELKEAEKKEREQKRRAYKNSKEALINELGNEALELHKLLTDFKNRAMQRLADFRIEMLEYGDLRGGNKNKGNFELKNEKFKINYTNQVIKSFNELSKVAEQHINEFLKSFLKKKDKKTHDFISNIMERDEASGQFDIDMINRLYTMEDSFDDPNWKLGIKLFKESYVPANTAQYSRFAILDPATGVWTNLVLDFAKIKAAVQEEEAENE